MSSSGKHLVLCLFACAAMKPFTVGQSGSIFAGWIRSGHGGLIIRAGKEVTRLDGTRTVFKRIYSGEYIRVLDGGRATLLVFGRQTSLTPKMGWFRVPDSLQRSMAGINVYERFVSRAGRNRGESMTESYWRALCLIDLQSPNVASSNALELRIVRFAENGRTLPLVVKRGRLYFRVGDHISVEVSNHGALPIYPTLIDIDMAGQVVCLTPKIRKVMRPIMPNTGWQRLPGSFRISLPDAWSKGTEIFKIIATSRPIDLSALETTSAVAHEDNFRSESDALMYLTEAASGIRLTEPIGPWAVRSVEFTVQDESDSGI